MIPECPQAEESEPAKGDELRPFSTLTSQPNINMMSPAPNVRRPATHAMSRDLSFMKSPTGAIAKPDEGFFEKRQEPMAPATVLVPKLEATTTPNFNQVESQSNPEEEN